MTPVSLRWNDSIYLTGLFFIVASILIFIWPFSTPNDDKLGQFAINFILAAGYFFIALFSGKLRRKHENIHILFVFLVLGLISAYSLNREMTVFQQSTNWMCILLVACCVNYLCFPFFSRIPAALKHVMCFILGIATILFFYLSVYLLPLYGIGIAAFFLLGISLHTFVPLLFTVLSVILLWRIVVAFKQGLWSFLSGVLIVAGLAMYYIITWNNIVSAINDTYHRQVSGDDNSLPAWVRVSQVMEAGPVTEKVLKAGLSYAVPARDWNFTRMPQRNFGEQQKHDPLVMVSAMATEKVHLSDEERVNILRSLYDSRHQAEQRLWSGENLVTDYVNTKVKIWPSFRLAYTEKILTVTNQNTQGWGNSEEAIYTFHLPEGGVVTSLSLWINGKEEKAILTTREKAANAYNSIVGIERRDPSVVHWQEGNRVSVRVFPVLPGESRMFKVGITSPVAHRSGDLVYDNIWFDGPLVKNAREYAKIDVVNGSGQDVPFFFSANGSKSYIYSGSYHPAWSMSCKVEPLAGDVFGFDGHVYSVEANHPVKTPAGIQHVYLDINGSWQTDLLGKVWDVVKDKKVFVCMEDEMIEINENNKDAYFETLTRKRFSLFPFHLIDQPSRSLVITHSSDISPNLEELKGSGFLENLQQSFSPGQRYRLYNLSSGLSPFLASLHEKRYFHYDAGNAEQLAETISSGLYNTYDENAGEVVIHQAGTRLLKRPGEAAASTAPDHLVRLFAYNHIMQQLGENPNPGEQLTRSLAESARQAYIVTPLSSLVVLETRHDYDRFDISEQGNSLKNASMKSTGAVPEPHEWALIVLASLVVLYARFPQHFRRILWKA